MNHQPAIKPTLSSFHHHHFWCQPPDDVKENKVPSPLLPEKKTYVKGRAYRRRRRDCFYKDGGG